MTKDDVRKLLLTIDSAYPNFNAKNPGQMVDVWYDILKDKDIGEIAASLKAYIMTNTSGFPPAIGQLVQGTSTEQTASEAWSLVYKAICNSGYGSVEEFEKLPPLVQAAVGSPRQLQIWAVDEDFSEGVASSNFRRAYDAAVEREKREVIVRAAIGEINRPSIEEGLA